MNEIPAVVNDLQAAAKMMDSRPEAAAQMVGHSVEKSGRYLGLPFEPEAPPAVDTQIAAELKTVLTKYLPLAAALAADDDAAAKSTADALAAAIRTSSLPMKVELAELADNVASAENLKERRSPFQPLSDDLIRLVRANGIDAVGDAYVVHCPMAAGGDGADWLSDKPEVVNPYFGDSMLSCGTVTDTLSTSKSAPANDR